MELVENDMLDFMIKMHKEDRKLFLTNGDYFDLDIFDSRGCPALFRFSSIPGVYPPSGFVNLSKKTPPDNQKFDFYTTKY